MRNSRRDGLLPRRWAGRHPGASVSQHLSMRDAESLYPSLLPQRDADEKTELDELLLAEMLVEPRPEVIVGKLRVPDDRARPRESGLLSLVELVRPLELEQI